MWHRPQPLVSNTSLPRFCSSVAGSAAGLACAARHASNSLTRWAMRSSAICACCSPQNSAQRPCQVPSLSARMTRLLSRPGMMSRLPATLGTPERVDHVVGPEDEPDRLADRHTKLVGGDKLP